MFILTLEFSLTMFNSKKIHCISLFFHSFYTQISFLIICCYLTKKSELHVFKEYKLGMKIVLHSAS